jgi:hypothetical protein
MNCKPGDLAIIVKAPLSRDGGPLGLIVEVLGDGETDSMFGFCWLCKFRTPMETVGGHILTTLHVADDWLKPISGLPIDEEITDEVTA